MRHEAGDSREPENPLVRAEALLACTNTQCAQACAKPGTACHFNELACQDQICRLDEEREARRAASAEQASTPVITELRIAGQTVWRTGDPPAKLQSGERLSLIGQGFGEGPDVDFSKIMIGNSRVLETDLKMYEHG